MINKLNFQISYKDSTWDKTTTRHIILKIMIDNIEYSSWGYSFTSLFDSISKDGEYYIFTCSCGTPGCAGIFNGVIVIHEENHIIWKVPDPISIDTDDENYNEDDEVKYKTYTFDKNQYAGSIISAIEKIKEYIRTCPHPRIQMGDGFDGDVSYILKLKT